MDKLKSKGSSDKASEVGETSRAEVMWITEAQKMLVGSSSWETLKRQFSLFLDGDGNVEVRRTSDIPYQAKHPILLPKEHYLSTLIVRRAHERVFHNGVKETLTEIQSRFWLVKGRTFIKKIVHQEV